MLNVGKLLKEERYDELWNICCGFLDLDVDQFVNIQNQLLLEQLEHLLTSNERG